MENLKMSKQKNGTLEITKEKTTIIITPHFQKRMIDRKVDLKVVAKICIKLLEMNLKYNENYILKLDDNKQIVFDKVYNSKRQRDEIEFISITPTNFCYNFKYILGGVR